MRTTTDQWMTKTKHQYKQQRTVAVSWSIVGNIVNSRGIKTKHLQPTPTQ